MTESEKLTIIAKIIKGRFPNISFNDVLDLAQQILNEVNK